LQLRDGFALAECFDREKKRCAIIESCVLEHALGDALAALIAELNKRTLADLVAPKALLRELNLVEDLAAPPVETLSTRKQMSVARS
jgi:DNA-binding IscR family transcriptional regulator